MAREIRRLILVTRSVRAAIWFVPHLEDLVSCVRPHHFNNVRRFLQTKVIIFLFTVISLLLGYENIIVGIVMKDWVTKIL